MRPSLLLVPALVLSFPVWAVEPQVTAVLLTQAGVATVEQEAKVKGDDTLDLTVPFSQVDDVLKSLIVLDPAGAVQRVTLAGSSDDSALADLPVPPEALTSTSALLQALVGQSIEIDNTLRSQKGRLMAVVEREEAQGKDRPEPVRRLILSLLTETGLTEAVLEPGATVRLADKALQARLDRALASLAEGRDRSARTLSISVAGQGERVAKLAYVVAAPVWKATYRLDLAPDGKTARLQGWAVLENRTGKDWKNIRLTLSSGQPVTFRQPLYASTWVDRPEVPLTVAKVRPLEADQGAVEMAAKAELPRRAAPMAIPAPLGSSDTISYSLLASPSRPEEQPRTMAQVSAASVDETLTQINLTLPQTISVAAGQSLSVPIVDRVVPAQQVLVWDGKGREAALQAAVDVTNASESSLPPGAVALYEGARGFVGDGRLDLLPKGESRFIAYARDAQARLTREEQTTTEFTGLTVANGVAVRNETLEVRTTYRAVLPETDTRPLLIDHPRLTGVTLVAPKENVRESGQTFRFTVPNGAERRLEVVTQRQSSAQINLRLAQVDWALFQAQGTGFSPSVVAALDKLAQLKAVAASHEQDRKAAVQTRAATELEQKRLRESLQAVPASSDLARRYMKDLGAAEDLLVEQRKAIDAASKAADAANKSLSDFIATLTIP
ncbi:hypothetical protein VZ95_04625 [Elstera litoralis]|uniref:DUF4139 domain-containing protein n=1 Tax=Elstera litoralis TaxID=552518 RepID=A0A0F3IXZ7_9PROT|nr:DUF4139 domain-containing protein [Elstera litoralis]KJV10479.1 hypothetical protein VZ95_04625 [Elstera litoralis]